jgi:hypothetical protein
MEIQDKERVKSSSYLHLEMATRIHASALAKE